MSTINSGPNIPSNGLLMCLDAGNNKSYSGAGSVWRDLSSNNYDCNLFGSPSWDGQKFIFPNTQTGTYAALPIQALNNLTSGTIYTFELLATFDNTNATEYFLSCATSTDNNLFIMAQDSTIRPFSAATGPGTPTPVSVGETMYLTITNKTGIIDVYKNGEFSCSWSGGVCTGNLKLTEGWILNQEQDSVSGSFDPNQACAMKASFVRLYDRTLSESEIKNNYNAVKTKFGL